MSTGHWRPGRTTTSGCLSSGCLGSSTLVSSSKSTPETVRARCRQGSREDRRQSAAAFARGRGPVNERMNDGRSWAGGADDQRRRSGPGGTAASPTSREHSRRQMTLRIDRVVLLTCIARAKADAVSESQRLRNHQTISSPAWPLFGLPARPRAIGVLSLQVRIPWGSTR